MALDDAGGGGVVVAPADPGSIPPIVQRLMDKYGLSEADARAMAGLPATKTPSQSGAALDRVVNSQTKTYWEKDATGKYHDTGIPAGTAAEAGRVNVTVPGAVQAPYREIPNMPGYSVNQTTGRVVGPDGQPVDPQAFAALQQQAMVRQRELLKTPEEIALVKAQIADLQARIPQWQQDYNLKVQTQDFLRQKQSFEETMGRAADARATSQQLFTQQNDISTLQLHMADAVSKHNDLQAQLQQQTALANMAAQNQTGQFNAQMGFDIRRANVAAQQAKQQQLEGLATNIGTLAQDPGSRGRLASYILANSGWGQENANLPGADFRTNESLMPLDSLLRQRNQVAGQPDNPFTFAPVTAAQAAAPQLPLLDFSGVQVPKLNVSPAAAAATTAPAASVAPGIDLGKLSAADLSAGKGNAAISGTPANAGDLAQQLQQSLNAAGLAHLAQGGLAKGAYISGEQGPEINIPLAAGKALVINQKMAKSPEHFKKLAKLASGGVFDAGSVFGDTGGAGQDTSLASSFLAQSLANARAGTPFAKGVLPTPVFASTPGTSPIVAQLLASLNAQGRGLPASEFERQRQLLVPVGMAEAPVRRTF